MKSPSTVDIHVGDRLRTKRLALGLSIEGLANELGTTAQKVQQWETGVDRVGALYLQKLSAILAVDLNYFFTSERPRLLNGDVGVKRPNRPESLFGLAASVEDLRLIHAFANIKNVAFREAVIKLAETMAESECAANPEFGHA